MNSMLGLSTISRVDSYSRKYIPSSAEWMVTMIPVSSMLKASATIAFLSSLDHAKKYVFLRWLLKVLSGVGTRLYLAFTSGSKESLSHGISPAPPGARDFRKNPG